MKAITLTQPWATLVAIGAKRIETRDWSTRYRGPLAIHAAKSFPEEARAVVGRVPFLEALNAAGIHRWDQLPLGQVLCVVNLDGCVRFDPLRVSEIRSTYSDRELAFGDFSAGRFGFYLSGLTRLATPVSCRGSLGVWNLPPDVEAAVLREGIV